MAFIEIRGETLARVVILSEGWKVAGWIKDKKSKQPHKEKDYFDAWVRDNKMGIDEVCLILEHLRFNMIMAARM